jgi:hypothetical protein
VNPDPYLAAANERRLQELFTLVRLRVAQLGPGGGEVYLEVRIDRGGRINRTSSMSVKEHLQMGPERA